MASLQLAIGSVSGLSLIASITEHMSAVPLGMLAVRGSTGCLLAAGRASDSISNAWMRPPLYLGPWAHFEHMASRPTRDVFPRHVVSLVLIAA